MTVYHHINGTGNEYDRISHALGCEGRCLSVVLPLPSSSTTVPYLAALRRYYTYRHAPRSQDKHARVRTVTTAATHTPLAHHLPRRPSNARRCFSRHKQRAEWASERVV